MAAKAAMASVERRLRMAKVPMGMLWGGKACAALGWGWSEWVGGEWPEGGGRPVCGVRVVARRRRAAASPRAAGARARARGSTRAACGARVNARIAPVTNCVLITAYAFHLRTHSPPARIHGSQRGHIAGQSRTIAFRPGASAGFSCATSCTRIEAAAAARAHAPTRESVRVSYNTQATTHRTSEPIVAPR